MTFTYNLGSSTASEVIISKIRLELGDNVEGAGVTPPGQNFADAEVDYAYTVEGDDIMLAVARLCEMLSRAYSAYAGIQMLNAHSEAYSKQGAEYAKRALKIREDNSEDFSFGTSTMTREDGYS